MKRSVGIIALMIKDATKMLHNTYFALRHGESIPNIKKIIISHPERGKDDEFTLTENGEQQVYTSVGAAKEQGLLGADTIIYSSPFSRCKRTAAIAKKVLGVEEEIHFDERLRERWFGDWDQTSNEHYEKVWANDAHDATHEIAHVESALNVQKRTMELIHELEQRYSGKKILLVSHGDALQIMQTAFHAVDARLHRSLTHFNTAEVRRLDLR